MATTVDLLTEIMSKWPSTLEEPSKKQPLSFADDPIALSCASWRMDQQGLGSYVDLNTVTVESEDRVLAAQVRKHFLDKLTLQKLRGGSQSQFRTKLGAFLVGNHELTKDEIGLLYRLPYFYHEDQCVQQVMDQTHQVELLNPAADATMTLTGVQKIWRHRRTGQATQFWFRNQHNWPVELVVLHTNPLHGVIDSLYDMGAFKICGRVWPRKFYESDRQYVKLSTFRLVSLGA